MENQFISKKLNNIIPGGAHTYSKGDDQFPGNAPAAILSGEGCYINGTDGKRYIDWAMGLTSVSLGHGDLDVANAVSKAAIMGTNFSRAAYQELEAAEFFIENIAPFHDMVKFTKNGSTATTAAVKLARAYTKREMIAVPEEFPFFSYDDWFIAGTDANAGTQSAAREQILKFKYGDINSLKDLLDAYPGRIAALIMEPVKYKLPPKQYLNQVKDICAENGVVFILDEMWCGAKLALGGGQEYFGVTADLATWGKGIANGFSCCALSGRREIMELGGINRIGAEKVFLVSTTHGAESTGLAAMMATIKKLKKENVLESNFIYGLELYEKLCKVIDSLELNQNIKVIGDTKIVQTLEIDFQGYDTNEVKTFLYQEMIGNGVLYNGLFYIMNKHRTLEIETTVAAFSRALERIKNIVDSNSKFPIVGSVIKPVFRKYN